MFQHIPIPCPKPNSAGGGKCTILAEASQCDPTPPPPAKCQVKLPHVPRLSPAFGSGGENGSEHAERKVSGGIGSPGRGVAESGESLGEVGSGFSRGVGPMSGHASMQQRVQPLTMLVGT